MKEYNDEKGFKTFNYDDIDTIRNICFPKRFKQGIFHPFANTMFYGFMKSSFNIYNDEYQFLVQKLDEIDDKLSPIDVSKRMEAYKLINDDKSIKYLTEIDNLSKETFSKTKTMLYSYIEAYRKKLYFEYTFHKNDLAIKLIRGTNILENDFELETFEIKYVAFYNNLIKLDVDSIIEYYNANEFIISMLYRYIKQTFDKLIDTDLNAIQKNCKDLAKIFPRYLMDSLYHNNNSKIKKVKNKSTKNNGKRNLDNSSIDDLKENKRIKYNVSENCNDDMNQIGLNDIQENERNKNNEFENIIQSENMNVIGINDIQENEETEKNILNDEDINELKKSMNHIDNIINDKNDEDNNKISDNNSINDKNENIDVNDIQENEETEKNILNDEDINELKKSMNHIDNIINDKNDEDNNKISDNNSINDKNENIDVNNSFKKQLDKAINDLCKLLEENHYEVQTDKCFLCKYMIENNIVPNELKKKKVIVKKRRRTGKKIRNS